MIEQNQTSYERNNILDERYLLSRPSYRDQDSTGMKGTMGEGGLKLP